MITEGTLLESRIHEYENILGESPSSCYSDDLSGIAQTLCKQSDWTDKGAKTILRLAQNYGTFMLRNALAVAIVLGREDGKKGF